MMKLSFTLLLVATVAMGVHAQMPTPLGLSLLQRLRSGMQKSNGACPPPGFDSVKNFNVSKYISAPWYVQKQIPIVFQPANTLYCVRAEYVPLDPSNPLKGVLVKNYANRDRVNGPATGTSGSGGSAGAGSLFGRFLASIPNPADPSKLSVGFAAPGSDNPLFGAPYWVVAADPNYQWAIITGGAPTTPSGNGKCSMAGTGGFWLFSRKPIDPTGTATMLQVAESLGLDTSVLLNVEQKGCTYTGA